MKSSEFGTAVIEKCYAAGEVIGKEGRSSGGLIGNKISGMVGEDSFYTGWDFENTWRIVEGVTYPILQWQPLTADEIIIADREALGWETIKGNNSDENNVTTNLVLPLTGENGSTIAWSANPAGYVDTSTGKVTRPADEDINVELTATFSCGEGTARTKIIAITIKKGSVYTVTLLPGENGTATTATGENSYVQGRIVTLRAIPAEGYNFDGWYNEEDVKVSSLPNYTFEASGDVTLKPKFKAMPRSRLKVIIEGQGSVKAGEEVLEAGQAYEYPINVPITLTAIADEAAGYRFAYWAGNWDDAGENPESGSIISINPVYTCTMGAGINIKAVFKEITTGDSDYFTVTFMNKGGKIIKTGTVEKGQPALAPGDPSLPGYTFIGWDKDFNAISSVLTVNALYQREQTEYTVTVENGCLSSGGSSGRFKFDMQVTVEADRAKSWEVFSHWLQDGKKVSTQNGYTFFAPRKDTVLEAIYVPASELDVKIPFITLTELADENGTLAYSAKRDIPDGYGYTLVESGIIFIESSLLGDGDELTLSTSGTVTGKISNSSTDQFYILKNRNGKEWKARAYLIYKDEDGNYIAVYSEQL
jgi:hypothetical protein